MIRRETGDTENFKPMLNKRYFLLLHKRHEHSGSENWSHKVINSVKNFKDRSKKFPIRSRPGCKENSLLWWCIFSMCKGSKGLRTLDDLVLTGTRKEKLDYCWNYPKTIGWLFWNKKVWINSTTSTKRDIIEGFLFVYIESCTVCGIVYPKL